VTPTTAPAQTNTEILRAVIDSLNRGDVASAKDFWTPATVQHFPDRVARGPEEIGAWFQDSLSALAGWHMEVVATAEEDDDLFVRWRLTGRHAGMWFGLAPTGKPITIDGMDHMVIRDGKLVENVVLSDQLDTARQVGLMPPQDSLAERGMKSGFNMLTKLTRARRSGPPKRA
jgi:predicted ester cyclase